MNVHCHHWQCQEPFGSDNNLSSGVIQLFSGTLNKVECLARVLANQNTPQPTKPVNKTLKTTGTNTTNYIVLASTIENTKYQNQTNRY